MAIENRRESEGNPRKRTPNPISVNMRSFRQLIDTAMSDPKPRPNRDRYIEALRRMTSEQRLLKAFELTEMSRAAFRQGLRNRHPELSNDELHQMYLDRLAKCHNQNY
jgi:hypothetical protein